MSFEDVRDVSTRGLEGSFYRVRSRLKVTWYEQIKEFPVVPIYLFLDGPTMKIE